MSRTRIGLLLGPLLSIGLFLLVPSDVIAAPAKSVAAVTVLMAVLWITEAIPIAATALIPVILFPLLGVDEVGNVTRNYAHPLVFLFLGGFWIAAALERSGAHRRIALQVIRLVGTRMDRVVLGFMIATAFLSMWLSNTATTMMMLPIAMAIASKVTHTQINFGRSLMLGIAYSASIGGVASLIGTPPNAVLAGVADNMLGYRITFWQWMQFGIPVSITMLAICWWYLARLQSPLQTLTLGSTSATFINEELASLGSMRRMEKRVIGVFGVVAFLWVFKGVLPFDWINTLDDSVIAMAGAISLFLLPAGETERGRLLDWRTAAGVPWDVLILFGGGFALAQGFISSGLTEWIGLRLGFLEGMHWLVLVGVLAVVTIFLTEVTSNTATASMLLPMVAGIAGAIGQNAVQPMVAAALAASFAFMLPVATPPNAIVFASRQLTIRDMARAGVWMNLIGIVMIVLAAGFLLPLVWDF